MLSMVSTILSHVQGCSVVFPSSNRADQSEQNCPRHFYFNKGKNMILLVQKNELLTIFFLEFGHKKKIIFSTFAAQTHVDYERVILSSKE